MTWRRLRVLIQGLPPESRTMTALRNSMPEEELEEAAERAEPEKGRWSQVEQLLALVSDRVARLEHTVICALVEKSKHPPEPEPIRRPGVQAARKKAKKAEPLDEQRAEQLFHLINGGAA
jgi:hypothetical protein